MVGRLRTACASDTFFVEFLYMSVALFILKVMLFIDLRDRRENCVTYTSSSIKGAAGDGGEGVLLARSSSKLIGSAGDRVIHPIFLLAIRTRRGP